MATIVKNSISPWLCPRCTCATSMSLVTWHIPKQKHCSLCCQQTGCRQDSVVPTKHQHRWHPQAWYHLWRLGGFPDSLFQLPSQKYTWTFREYWQHQHKFCGLYSAILTKSFTTDFCIPDGCNTSMTYQTKWITMKCLQVVIQLGGFQSQYYNHI